MEWVDRLEIAENSSNTTIEQSVQLRALYHLAVELSVLRSLESVLTTALKHCLDLTGSQFGFVGLTTADQMAMDVVEVQGFHAAREFYDHFRLIPLRPNLFARVVGELLAFTLTPGKVDDRQPTPALAKRLFGKLSQALFQQLWPQGVHLVTALRSNMKNPLMSLSDKLMLGRRHLIETINDQLKNISQIEHSRHRSPINFVLNLLAGLMAYTHQPHKPALNLSPNETKALALAH